MTSKFAADQFERSWRPERLSHDRTRNSLSIGCTQCPDLAICGGLNARPGLFHCLDLCCKSPMDCQRFCRANPRFAQRMLEIGGLTLENVPRVAPIPTPALPAVIPIIFHGDRREVPFDAQVVALKLHALIDWRTGQLRFADKESLCKAFKICGDAIIVLTGIDKDEVIERWWGIGLDRRRQLIRALLAADIAMVTTPNFSVCVDWPRWGDMGAMKRILHTFVEFAEEGMPAALHVNGRTDHDFDRWIECISKRPEITHIAYEFTTRSGAISRRPHHVAWLARIAQSISRPLHLIVAGRTDVLSKLAEVFPNRMSILETTSFMKALHRRAAVPMGNDVVAWKSAPTNPGQSVHHILAHNFDVRQSYLRMLASASLRTNS